MWYHGSKNKIDRFIDEFVGGEEAIDQEGPGIYFTSSIEDALMYGNWIHEVELNPRKIVSNQEGSSATEKELIFLMKQAPDWESHAQNWDENIEIGIRKAVKSILQYRFSQHDQFSQIYVDFFPYNAPDYVRAMSKLGYDMTIVDKVVKNEEVKHAIVLNPNIIESQGVKNISGELSESYKSRLLVLAGIKKNN